MASDLGATASEVHAKAREVLAFWFESLKPEQWFSESHGLDAQLGTRFGALRDEVLESGAADPLAQELATLAVERHWDREMPPERRQFFYLPFQHAESRELQTVSLRCFEALGLERSLSYAIEHAEVIARFGRFPTRNAALGRESTPEEKEYLSQPGVGW